MSENTPKAKESESLGLFIIVSLFVLAVWIGYWLLVTAGIEDAAARGQFGDMFGGVNAFFSALAFAVLIYTMTLQRKELALQRQELAETRIELARTASAQEKSEQALQKQVEAMTSFAAAGEAQARAMENLATATAQQVSLERELMLSSRDQVDAMRSLANAIQDVRRKM